MFLMEEKMLEMEDVMVSIPWRVVGLEGTQISATFRWKQHIGASTGVPHNDAKNEPEVRRIFSQSFANTVTREWAFVWGFLTTRDTRAIWNLLVTSRTAEAKGVHHRRCSRWRCSGSECA